MTEADLKRIETKLDALITTLHTLLDIQETTRATIAELAAWLKQPSDSDLPDLLRVLTASVTGLQDQIVLQGRMLSHLPAEVARAVGTGEVR